MDYGIAIIMEVFNKTLEEIKSLSVNQYKCYLHHAINLMQGKLMNSIELSYENTKEDKLRNRLKQLAAEGEERRRQSNVD